MGRLEGKVAVVTGGANGIGRACAERFAEEGADVLVADVLDADETMAAITSAGRRAVYHKLDASDPNDNEAAMQRAVDELGGLDVLVTAAGISHATYRSGDIQANLAGAGQLLTDFVSTDLANWSRVLDVNLTGTLLAVQSAARRMRDRGTGGSIVTIASIAAKVPEAAPVAYNVSKAGVWMITKVAARELATTGIRVNAIGPGYIRTNMTAIMDTAPEMTTQVLAHVPMGRMGTPAEVANVALFLASDEASYVTGEILHPDGGYYTD